MRRNWEYLVNAAERSGTGMGLEGGDHPWGFASPSPPSPAPRPQERTGAERQRILSHFQGLRLALEELGRHLLARLGHLERDIAKAQDENVTGLTQEISRLDQRVRELEEKCGEPARTFLQVGRDRGGGTRGAPGVPSRLS